MPIYLQDIPLAQAQTVFCQALDQAGLWQPLGTETLPLTEKALNRVLAEPIWARMSSPHYNASAMDGIAVRSVDTRGASEGKPLRLKGPQAFQYVDTGDALPHWANAVIPVEVVEGFTAAGEPQPDLRHAAEVSIRATTTPWKHVRTVGEDIISSELVLPEGHFLRPVDLGAIAASGYAHIRVYRKPKVAIIPTGTELIQIGEEARPGDIIEFNSIVLAAQVAAWGGMPERQPSVPDDLQQIKAAVQTCAATYDLVLLNAGSSAGSEDYSSRVVEELGALLVHGVAVRPGHPVILGLIESEDPQTGEIKNTPMIGVPGFPVSAALTGEIFVEPLLTLWSGLPPKVPEQIKAILTRTVTSPPGDDDYMRVALGRVDDRYLAAPISRGAGVITSLVRADGITIIPRSIQGYEAGTEITVNLYRNKFEIDRTILAIGSHDITLDLLAQFLQQYDRRFVSSNAGSLGGLLALKRGEAHLAGSHLLDPDTGEYNFRYLKEYLPDVPIRLIEWAKRQQGLIVSPGNPRDIHTLDDLVGGGVRFINRQRGSGTRMLLDYHLKQMGLDTAGINGYSNEEYTHLNVAVAVESGRVDCGLGIAAAAEALHLDFIPLFEERYDLVIPHRFVNEELLTPLFTLMDDPAFKHQIARMKGYDFSNMGRILLET